MAKTLIYHGSYLEIKKPEILKSKNTKDFGVAFYCTVIKEQAQRWARRYDNPVVNTYSFLPTKNLNIKEFPSMTEEWLDFIVDCRNGKSHIYDIVTGPMANDQIYNFVSDYIDGAITREQFWTMAKFKYPTHQIAFCTKESLNCLEYQFTEVETHNGWTRR